jgi:protein-L-isoaspartate(D-aspartate) O-methyltransferase
MTTEGSFSAERQRMVREQLLGRNIRDGRVLDAMRSVPRHLFVPPEHRHLAYADSPLPIGEEQTISQPYIVALMTQLLDLGGEENVLEVGTGSGYQAAVLSILAQSVHTIERHESLARQAEKTLQALGYENVFVHVGDGSCGLEEFAPYEAIVVTAAAPQVPAVLLEQLSEAGRMVIPVGARGNQSLERWIHYGEGFEQELLTGVAFVPLVGQFGWSQ